MGLGLRKKRKVRVRVMASAADFEDAPKRDYLMTCIRSADPKTFIQVFTEWWESVARSPLSSSPPPLIQRHPLQAGPPTCPCTCCLTDLLSTLSRHGQARAEHENFGVFLHCVCVCVCMSACLCLCLSVCLRFAQSPVSDHSMPGQELALQRFRQISVAEGVGKNIKKRLRSDDIPLIEGRRLTAAVSWN